MKEIRSIESQSNRIRNAAEQNREIRKVYDVIDARIERIYDGANGTLLEHLMEEYWKWWAGMKYISGTATGLNMLSEYFIFKVIRYHFKKELNLVFEPAVSHEKKNPLSTNHVWTFADSIEHPRLILAHGKRVKSYTPDISLHSYNADNQASRVVAVIEIKVLFNQSSTFNGAVESLARSMAQEHCRGWLVVLEDDSLPWDKCDLDLLNSAGIVFVGPRNGKLENRLPPGLELSSLECVLDVLGELAEVALGNT